MAQSSMTPISIPSAQRKVFVDTSAWYAVAGARDQYHTVARSYFEQALAEPVHFLTSDYILDETLTRLRYDFGHSIALRFWQQVEQARNQGSLTILWTEESVWQIALDLFRTYRDQTLSFTDCTSFALVHAYKPHEVFAFDDHFSLLGVVIQPGLK